MQLDVFMNLTWFSEDVLSYWMCSSKFSLHFLWSNVSMSGSPFCSKVIKIRRLWFSQSPFNSITTSVVSRSEEWVKYGIYLHANLQTEGQLGKQLSCWINSNDGTCHIKTCVDIKYHHTAWVTHFCSCYEEIHWRTYPFIDVMI